jgi:hypothetical protein
MEIDLFGDRATDDRKFLICVLETSFGICEEKWANGCLGGRL